MLCNMRSKLIPTDHIYIHKSIEMFYLLMCFSTPTCTLKLCLLYKLHNNAKKTLFFFERFFERFSPKIRDIEKILLLIFLALSILIQILHDLLF